MDFHLLYLFAAALAGSMENDFFQNEKYPVYGKMWYNWVRKMKQGKAGKI